MKTKKVIKYIIIFILLLILGFSTYKIIYWKIENDKVKNQSLKINENIKKPSNESEKKEKTKLDDYSVNFKKLKKINSSVVAYLRVKNTKIDYPVVKHKNNSYYLTHSFDKSYNSAGWIYSDYKNKYDGTDKNIVIYGHARLDESMFGTLKKVLNKSWYNDPSNLEILFITEDKKYLYEVFSIYHTKVEDYYITTDFNSDEEYVEFLNVIKKRSIKDFKTSVDKDDKILTLSTCYINENNRVVLHAKIKEMQNANKKSE